MKLPIPFLLYTTALGLVGFTGWTVYQMAPLLGEETRKAATGKGMKDATDRMSLGRGQLPVSADWIYGGRAEEWWPEFKAVNFLGKLPPPPPPPPGASTNNQPVVAPRDVRPLEQIIELVSLVYDSKDEGKGDLSHVIVRYRTEANVQPPEWYIRETTISGPAGGPAAAPRDVAPPVRQGGNPRGPQGRQNTANQPAPGGNRPGSVMPTSQVGREVLQKIWIQGDGDPRRDAKLWPPFADIQLVRVDPSAQIAYFTRTPPPANPGEPAPVAQEEPLHKTSMGLSQDILQELHRLHGTKPSAAATGAAQAAAQASVNTWQEVEETTLINNVRHIGRQQEQRIRENPDELWEKIHVDTYVSKQGKTRGLLVRSVDSKVAAQFGVEQGDVLLEVNGRAVQTQAQALQFGKGEYKKGVRTFVTKWLSAGQVVERIYQAPDK